MAIVPTVSAIVCTFATWIGIKLYADKLAKISIGSTLKKKSTTPKAGGAEANM